MAKSSKKSRYKGGFKKVGSRFNNTSEYNHDYYEKNKDKWKNRPHSRFRKSATNSGKVERRFYTLTGEGTEENPYILSFDQLDNYLSMLTEYGVNPYTHDPDKVLIILDNNPYEGSRAIHAKIQLSALGKQSALNTMLQVNGHNYTHSAPLPNPNANTSKPSYTSDESWQGPLEDDLISVKKRKEREERTSHGKWGIEMKKNVSYSQNELYHYGVIGMKWGVRKNKEEYYKKRSDISANKAKKAKTRMMKKFHTDRSLDFKEMADTSKRLGKAKGFKAKYIAKFGNARNARISDTISKKQEYRSKIARTKFGSDFSKANAKNMKARADTYNRIAKEKGITKKIVRTVERAWNQDYYKMSGRKTKAGREGVRRGLAYAIPYAMIADVGINAAEYAYSRRKKED